MKKMSFLAVAFFAVAFTASAQTTPTAQKPEAPKKVDKNIKKLEKKVSKVETLTLGNEEEIRQEEQAKPSPLKSKGADKQLNPQPFPPTDKNTGKATQPAKNKNSNH
ncbi:hypothetical protein [Mucilaginibacter psychrotolerans]|uniref:Uncharacterized protein n=1 Tax=Mucilaginibacter psychrotolerans TaxID=1524096 RepID=A0A4Y8SAT5_9SPHI|nr:hypothetical protein [Mucilaginibacter psychrotolerans]TFF35544.1 hypothetical protein E2R66_18850 [Mucilaginibacter psychrotolerans]